MNKINPFLQFFFGAYPEINRLVKTQILHKRKGCGKNHDPRKSEKKQKGERIKLCELKMNIHRVVELWITPVEKLVENVENCELSTGISDSYKIGSSCGKLPGQVCITRENAEKCGLRYQLKRNGRKGENDGKVYKM